MSWIMISLASLCPLRLRGKVHENGQGKSGVTILTSPALLLRSPFTTERGSGDGMMGSRLGHVNMCASVFLA
ncbi:hypothetical protein AKJ16_DCAP22009 [Drosera capensis]